MSKINHTAFHDSQDITYRSPFGATAAGREIYLAFDIQSRQTAENVALRLWSEDEGEKVLAMELVKEDLNNGIRRYQTVIKPDHHQILWYYFTFTCQGILYYYSRPDNRYGGVGCLDIKPLHSYQITIYKPDFHVPRWYREGIMYQLFPDRFNIGNSYDSDNFKKGDSKKGIILHENWGDAPNYEPDPAAGEVLNNDFFGGNLQGIIDKLDYLQDLGITILYLNPIFEAYSNHRYDTGDYFKIDPMLGNMDIFNELCKQAEDRGISIILDGVFSHTGSDSLYFNKDGNYPSTGAWQSKDSPYYPWYNFNEFPDDYDCWWGVKTLPNVNEMEPSYLDFIIGNEDSVIKHWLRQGISGWRLDVADELPDGFIKALRRAVKEVNPQGVVIGEVWEDASNKVSYGSLRKYLLGEELDAVMNYPFRNIILKFLLGSITAEDMQKAALSLYENYPAEVFYGSMNLLGTHDVPRLRTLLGETPSESGLSRKEQSEYRMTEEQRALADKRQRLAVVLQMTLPGVPSIYYGDEAGMEGYSDPHNRKTYPWGEEDTHMIQWYKKLTYLRNTGDVLKRGGYIHVYCKDGVYGYMRLIENNRDVFGETAENDLMLIIVNRDRDIRNINIDLSKYPVHELKNLLDPGEPRFKLCNGCLILTLEPVSSVILSPDFALRPE